MSADTRKRKRKSDAGPEETQPRKTRVVGDTGEAQKSRGQLRQERSERRSKKTTHEPAKEQSEGQVIKDNDSKTRVSTRPGGDDDLAGGQDFVPLSTIPSLPRESGQGEPDAANRSKGHKQKPGPGLPSTDNGDHDLQDNPTNSSKPATPAKFIVFVGNLPYSTTTEQIESHFAKLAPFKTRHNTDRSTGKSKGFAFLEFENYDRMKTCLQLYHHSIFDPGQQANTKVERNTEQDAKPGRAGRRINVELTAGGGGKSKQRKLRIKSKNEKLAEERERRLLKDKAERAKVAQERKDNPATGANANGSEGNAAADNGIHPSRLKRMRW